MIRVTFEAIIVQEHRWVFEQNQNKWETTEGKLIGTQKGGTWNAVSFFSNNSPKTNFAIRQGTKFGRVGKLFYFDGSVVFQDFEGDNVDNVRGIAFETTTAAHADSFEAWLEGLTGRNSTNFFRRDNDRPHDRHRHAGMMSLLELHVEHQDYVSRQENRWVLTTEASTATIPAELYGPPRVRVPQHLFTHRPQRGPGFD